RGRKVRDRGDGRRRSVGIAAGLPLEVSSAGVQGLDGPGPALRVGRLRRIVDIGKTLALVIPGPEAEEEGSRSVCPVPLAPDSGAAALSRELSCLDQVARGGNARDAVALADDAV